MRICHLDRKFREALQIAKLLTVFDSIPYRMRAETRSGARPQSYTHCVSLSFSNNRRAGASGRTPSSLRGCANRGVKQ